MYNEYKLCLASCEMVSELSRQNEGRSFSIEQIKFYLFKIVKFIGVRLTIITPLTIHSKLTIHVKYPCKCLTYKLFSLELSFSRTSESTKGYTFNRCVLYFTRRQTPVRMWGAVAQWLERATDNRVIAGSNPTEAFWKLWQFPLPHFASVFRKRQ